MPSTMSRTNIEIDEELIARVMRRHGLTTKREAVDFALRSVAGPEPMTKEEVLAMEGRGWGDGLELSDLRDNDPIQEW